jgi:hypothetical protein
LCAKPHLPVLSIASFICAVSVSRLGLMLVNGATAALTEVPIVVSCWK